MARRLVDVHRRILRPGQRSQTAPGRMRHPVRRSRAMTACTVAAGLIALGVGPANADHLKFADASGDMTGITESSEGATGEPAANHDAGDVTVAVIRHGKRAVTVNSSFAQLRRSHFNGFHGKLRTGSVIRYYSVIDDPKAKPVLGVFTKRFKPVCDGATLDVDYKADTLRIRVPRKCLKRPEWVKATMMSANHRARSNTYYLDDALTGTPVEDLEDRLTWSGRVRL